MNSHGAGTYLGWSRCLLGANCHWIQFDKKDERSQAGAVDGQLRDLDKDLGWESFGQLPKGQITTGRPKRVKLKLSELQWRVI